MSTARRSSSGWPTPGGVVSTTGVGGLTLHGGWGWLRRKYGLSLDNLLSVEIVTADGQVRTASATENADLFWAVRGAGSNFGVVTSFEFRLHPVGPLGRLVAAIFYAWRTARTVLPAWRDFMATAPDEVSSVAASCGACRPPSRSRPSCTASHRVHRRRRLRRPGRGRASGSCSRCASWRRRCST